VASCGNSDSIITRLWRIPMREPGTESMRTGQTSMHAAQVVHAQISSLWTCAFTPRYPPSSRTLPGRSRSISALEMSGVLGS